ncbi:1-(5-phosphoribosyl)-5-[(5-phosphoribosylamino)methylideneamino]imidazole-4-carboxamide isomerase [Virgibacillus phasianinus]|uniref:1-(5-phosphoribosyl)-5-[(5-phosphoribosylamino)methylideneamino] imidazole-4-carboxamide isomerase n=1 Tax=Virgibacillus phasianinus TaxID=2017483 RepID=A0A220U047_9BACI|nr:1-(5-phosphoribosyl)-5-[(5-phosphoribosylamino)methylideneamino]imidazole-4-carboxamide isomerase [Virgibacillus phasianinus]ASK61420.1 1-(5-phosphoribosyl)-5-[(5-phosphoribosylamino)methylideneamino]imidazole-4-carboxamide isomerase [Virgibacillus phasianinus]
MILFPAIDIRNGKCVRLTQGDYKQERIYSDSPIDVARQWESAGAAYIHVVDLDGAKTGNRLNLSTIKEIVQSVQVPVQVGGGIRSIKSIEDYQSIGVSRVIMGTAAIEDKVFLREAVSTFGGMIAVSIDARKGMVATNGWTKTSDVAAVDLLKELDDLGVRTIIYTDIFKDGMSAGPNLQELSLINDTTKQNIIASGGISSLEDIKQLREMDIYGGIVGKALYDGTLSLSAILKGDNNAR